VDLKSKKKNIWFSNKSNNNKLFILEVPKVEDIYFSVIILLFVEVIIMFMIVYSTVTNNNIITLHYLIFYVDC
jgi:hypothetical protein